MKVYLNTSNPVVEMEVVTDSWQYSIVLGDKWVNTNQASKQWGNIYHTYWRHGMFLKDDLFGSSNDKESGI